MHAYVSMYVHAIRKINVNEPNYNQMYIIVKHNKQK